jgi:hypothetical protein
VTRRFSFDGEWFEVAQADVPPVSSHPLVTLVLTAFQRSAQLPSTLRSLQQQTYRNLEILVVEADHDGGKTEELCQRFGVGYLRRWNKADRGHEQYRHSRRAWRDCHRAIGGVPP